MSQRDGMVFRICRILFFCTVAVAALTPGAAARRSAAAGGELSISESKATDHETDVQFQIQANPYFRTTISNWGYFGNVRNQLIDSATVSDTAEATPAPAFESPSFSGIEYLFEAGLWLGGIVGNDTLVSTGTLGWGQAHEFFPAAGDSPVASDVLGDQEFAVVYDDLLSDTLIVGIDPVDGAHRPLPLRVSQITRLVDDPVYQHGLIIELTITNTGMEPIHGLWVGWMTDCDIGHVDVPGVWLHDISGYSPGRLLLDGQTRAVGVAWSADINGRPDTASGLFDERSPRGAFATAYLGGTPELPDESFNWWVSNLLPSRVHDWDWGPQRAPADTNYLGGHGTPLGDAMKYRYLANGEIDYAQVLTAADSTGAGWIAPPAAEVARELADGYDTRFLHSAGAVDLLPGESLKAAWGWAVAPDWHTDPDHFARTFDPGDPSDYLAGLGVGALATAMARLQVLWASRFDSARIGAPTGFALDGWDDHEAHLRWSPRGTARLGGYQILRSQDSTIFNGQPLITLTGDDSLYRDSNLDRAITYYYTISSLDSHDRPGPAAAPVGVLPDRPLAPLALHAARGDAAITISWTAPREPDVVGHRIYRRIPPGGWMFKAETAALTDFTDRTADNAVVYEYRIGAVSALGNESFPSDAVRGIAFAFAGLPLVLDQTSSAPAALTARDSVRAVWTRLPGGGASVYQDADPVNAPPVELAVYNPHPALVVVSDGRGGLRPEVRAQLPLYSYAAGAMILAGRDLFNDEPITEGTIAFGPGDFAYDNLGITAAYYPRVLLAGPTRMNAEFVGARAARPGLPDLVVDSARTDWGLNPALPSTAGAVPFVGYFTIDTSRAEVLYTFVSRDAGSSEAQGRPVAVVSRDPDAPVAAFAFPLSYMEEAAVREVLITLWQELGWRSNRAGDLDGDGSLSITDAVILIDYLYRGGELAFADNADISATVCRTDIVDLATLLSYLTLGSPEPIKSCKVR